MCIECTRCGIVGSHGGGNGNAVALVLKFVCNALYRYCVGIHAQHAVLGLVSCGQCSASCCRVGDCMAGRVTCSHRCHGELKHQQGFLVAKNGLVVSLGTKHGAQSHAVANEVENVLGFLCSHGGKHKEHHE